MENIFFLSGLPRSGSTVLNAIISQNPDFTVAPTSPFLDLLCYTNEALNKTNFQYTYDFDKISLNLYKSIFKGFYQDCKTKYVLDKHRGHPRNVIPWRQFLGIDPKIICTIRPVADIIASYIKLIEETNSNNFVDDYLTQNNISINTANRAKCLWEEYISDPYQSAKIGLENHRECILFVNYDDLISNPEKEMEIIYSFLNVSKYTHNFFDIQDNCSEEKDFAWGLENLHKIRSVLQKTSTPASSILGQYLTDFYNQYNLIY